MTDDEEREIVALMGESMARARGYADFFGWSLDRNLEEWGVLQALRESLEAQGRVFYYTDLRIRGRSHDPPDCEARDADGRRVAVEVTELVSEDAIRAYKAGRVYDFALWDRESFLASLAQVIARKDSNYPRLKDPPYHGGYELVVFSYEPMLSRRNVDTYLAGHVLEPPANLSRVVLLLGYDPGVSRCPIYELYSRA